MHLKRWGYSERPPRLVSSRRRTQRSTFMWTVAGYHPIACRGLAYSTRLWELDVCIRFGPQSLAYLYTHTGVKQRTLPGRFASGEFHPLVARLTTATSVGFHSCASRAFLFGLGLNCEYGPLHRARALPKRVLRSTLSVYVGPCVRCARSQIGAPEPRRRSRRVPSGGGQTAGPRAATHPPEDSTPSP